MNLEDRVTILEEEISVLKVAMRDVLKSLDLKSFPQKVMHVSDNIEDIMYNCQQSMSIYKKFEEAKERIDDIYIIAKNFSKLEEIREKAEGILKLFGGDESDDFLW